MLALKSALIKVFLRGLRGGILPPLKLVLPPLSFSHLCWRSACKVRTLVLCILAPTPNLPSFSWNIDLPPKKLLGCAYKHFIHQSLCACGWAHLLVMCFLSIFKALSTFFLGIYIWSDNHVDCNRFQNLCSSEVITIFNKLMKFMLRIIK